MLRIAFYFTLVGIPVAVFNLVTDGSTTAEWLLLIMQIPCFSIELDRILNRKS